ncbi:hypothetical protein DFJ77DRAFT_448894 [Powellomyces hirtus]|nr:hypothetical protein DFJ77DRAFT_448894 [Powellomyces hirtus]
MTLPTSGKERRTARRTAIYYLIKAATVAPLVTDDRDGKTWACCNSTFTTHPDISRHVQSHHAAEIAALEGTYLTCPPPPTSTADAAKQPTTTLSDFHSRRAAKGSSDPITLQCTCPPATGLVLLFYKYAPIPSPTALAAHQHSLCTSLGLAGKLRISPEGINVTLAGSTAAVEQYMDVMSKDKLLRGCALQSTDEGWEKRRELFFKPSEGCVHVFDGLSVKVVDEVCPFGVKGYIPNDLLHHEPERTAHHLAPSEFHALLTHATANPATHVVLDTRNHYETHLGHFENAVLPPIRKFSSLPAYVNANQHLFQGKTVLTYCTGGVRCEKAARWIGDHVQGVEKVVMLDGGIHNYLEWVKDVERQKQVSTEQDHVEIEDKDSSSALAFTNLFKGRNYVFDARQSLAPGSSTPVTVCKFCGTTTGVYAKCARAGCHLMVTTCDACSQSEPAVFCCSACNKKHGANDEGVKPSLDHGIRWMCTCETERRERLFKRAEPY